MSTVYIDFFGNVMPQSAAPTNTVTGSAGSEPLSGTSGDDLLVGGGAGHGMAGGTGDDTYQVNALGDSPVEQPGEGVDTVIARNLDHYSLPENIENLFLFGKMTAFGNDGNNLIVGNLSSQTITGGAGDDVIEGGAGADTFVFGAGSGYDVVTDFSEAQSDQVQIQNYGFTNFAQVQNAMTQAGSDVVLQLDSHDAVKFLNITVAGFQAADFLLSLDQSNLNVSFDEEFNGPLSLYDPATGTGVWSTSFQSGDQTGARAYTSHTLRNNGEKEIYVDPDFAGSGSAPLGLNPFSISGGVLDINAQATTDAEKAALWYYKYTSGLLTTQHSFAQTYGYFEIKAQLPAGQGVWPAFWLVPTNGVAPPELDVLENTGGSTSYFTSHSAVSGVDSNTVYTPSASTQFHTYGLLWTNTQLTWYVDGGAVASMLTPSDMNQPMYLLVNLAIGGSFPGNPSSTFTSANMLVDYVRAYSLNASGGEDGDLGVTTAHAVIGDAGKNRVVFTVIGLDAGATGVVTFLDSQNQSVVVNVSANGQGFADLSGLADGNVTVTVAANTPDGSTLPGAGENLTIDPTVASDLAVALPINIGAAGQSTASFTLSGMDSGDTATVTFTDNQGRSIAEQISANGMFTADLSSLTAGGIQVGVTETGGSGPTLTGLGGKFALDTSADVGGDLTLSITPLANAQNTARLEFALVGLDKDAAARVTFTDSGGHTVTTTVNSNSSPFVNLSGFVDGTVTASITATDGAGNVANGASVSFTLDTTADVGHDLAVSANSAAVGEAGRGNAGFTVAGLDPDATAIVTFSDASGSTATATVASNGVGTADLSGLAGGPIAISIAATDAAGNTAMGAGSSFTLDTTADAGADLAVSANSTMVSEAGKSSAGFTVAGLDPDATAIVTFSDAGGSTATATVASNGVGTADLSGLADGPIAISIAATDAAGNTATGAGSSLTLDTTADVSHDLAVALGEASANASEKIYVPYAVSGLDSDATAVVTFTDQGNDTKQVTLSGNGGGVVNLSALAMGIVHVSVTATDSVGNTATVSGGEIAISPGQVEPLDSSNVVVSGAGITQLHGGSGDDLLVWAPGVSLLDGGGGSDTASFDDASAGVKVSLVTTPQKTGGAGVDTLSSIENLIGSSFNDTLKGDGGANVLLGGAGDDSLNGGDGNDVLAGGNGNDTLSGGSGTDTASYTDAASGVTVSLAITTAQATLGAGTDTLTGIENLTGSSFSDTLSGSSGANVIMGGDGADVITGNKGADILYGGGGADQFVYLASKDSTVAVAGQDQIMDFSHSQGDRIDLSAIDANTKIAGNDAFTLLPSGFSHHAGELIQITQTGGYLVEGDTNGDGVADFAIFVHANAPLVASDFIL